MRDKPRTAFEKYRNGAKTGDNFGSMIIPYNSTRLFVIFADGRFGGWEHVSVSTKNRCPNWQEMDYVKDIFWGEDEVVSQFHVKKKDWINLHNYCLHMWKQVGKEVELPPRILV